MSVLLSAVVLSLLAATAAQAAPSAGELLQLPGSRGCIVDDGAPKGSCARARALSGSGPFMGSRAIALSPDGESVYVASSKSDAIAIFARNAKTGALKQRKGPKGCIAAEAADGCAPAIGLDGPNSVAVSLDGTNVYATSRATGSVTSFVRNQSTGALRQPVGAGCVASVPIPGCVSGRGLLGADVVIVSPDGENVYVGAFFGNAVATFDRDAATGSLAQPADETGCITAAAVPNCAIGLALNAPEGMAISADGEDVYVASAASGALLTLTRDTSTGALTQATDGGGCTVDDAIAGCDTGVQLSGANAVEVSSSDGDVYVTSLLSNSITSFTRSDSAPLAQKAGTEGCLVFLKAVGCSMGHALSAPEGIAVSPDGANVYATSFSSGAIDIFDRDAATGSMMQKAGRSGCLAKPIVKGCRPARRTRGASSIAVSPDGRHVYAVAFESNAISIFNRRTK